MYVMLVINRFHFRQISAIYFFIGVTFLGRHFGRRPLDPTLDIWSNFVKKESILPPFLKQRLPGVTKGYQGSPRFTKGYQRLPKVTKGY